MRSGGATGASASGMSRVEFQTEQALIEGTVLAPMSEAAALEAGQMV